MKTKENNKTILLISPTWVNLHSDIVRQLVIMGYDVEFIPENSFPEDSYRVKGKRITVNSFAEESLKTDYWRENITKIDQYYDYLIVIDGQGVNEFLFNTLKSKNPNIRCINYLYDTTHSVYHFEKNFGYFDKVFTFDRQESEKYEISLLPIYWMPAESGDSGCKFDIFGFGAYSRNRFELYEFIKEISESLGKKTFIKTYHNTIGNKVLHAIKNLFRSLVGKDTLISLSEYSSDIITHDLVPSADFRKLIQSSDVIIDSKVLDQDGLTARFMWALGAGKKIITTNAAALTYPFYSEEQILILDEGKPLRDQKAAVRKFLASEFNMSNNCRKIVEKFRIDNWINTLFSID